MARSTSLSANIVDFCARLRDEHQFLVGYAEAREALRAIEISGITDPDRLKCALRISLCTKPAELGVFDDAFDAFFRNPERGLPQSAYAPRHSRTGPDHSVARSFRRSIEPQLAGPTETGDSEKSGVGPRAVEGHPVNAAAAWETLRAQYSPEAAATVPPVIMAATVRERLAVAQDLVSSVRLGRLRRWKPKLSGHRFDMRRTLRTSLRTGGDPVALHFLGHPLRNPRFVVLIDGSRSMASHGPLMLEFAYALVRTSRRASIFVFSTRLREVTLELRRSSREPVHQLSDIGEAWGGGTRIGESLLEFVHDYRNRRLSNETVTIVYSDGLDVGDAKKLGRAMRDIHSHSAAVIWVNPLVGTDGYVPAAGGMSAALPYLDAFIGVRDAAELAGIARHAALATR